MHQKIFGSLFASMF